MNIKIQLFCFIISFIYGFLIDRLMNWHIKKLQKENLIIKLIICILLTYIIVISYVDIIYFINNGNFHIYFILLIIIGIIVSKNIKRFVKLRVKNRK